jgi:photosystem II stability/assembly factor-like uncharacterized protein
VKVNLGLNCSYCDSFHQIVALSQQGAYLALAEGWLYRSADRGVSWRKQSQAWGRVFPADAGGQHLYLVNGNLLESNDGGKTWKDVPRQFTRCFQAVNISGT